MFKSKKLETVDTIIGKDTIVEGDLKLATSLRVDGKIFGTIACEGDLIIGKTGHVEHSIRARNVHIAGIVTGELVAEEKVQILPGGSFSGNAVMKGLVIEDGGSFEGQSQMNHDKENYNEKNGAKQEDKDKNKAVVNA